VARWLSGSLLGGPYAASGWRAEHGALLDLGPHVIDLLDVALGPVGEVEWAHRSDPDVWNVGLRHVGGALSTAVLSLQLPVDPSEIELAVFGGVGRHQVGGRVGDARACYARLLDELVAAVRGDGPPPPLDVARGLRLQEIVDAAVAAAAR
jgi:predicted dehydrogenase